MIRLELPKPPSTNTLFPTNRKTGRRHISKEYERWLTNARAFLWMSNVSPMAGPVHISIHIEDTGKVDLDNSAKAAIDFCVSNGLIEDDNRSIVRKLTMQWGVSKGCIVEITEVK